jgi:predicted nucleic acid-binding protein
MPAPLSDQAEAILRDSRGTGVRLVAPALLAFEVTSVLRRLVYLGDISAEQGDSAFDQFRRLQIWYTHRQAIFPVAWQLAKELNRPRAYDTAYVAVAQMHNCDFWTADRRFYNAVADEIDTVRWIGDYSTAGPPVLAT